MDQEARPQPPGKEIAASIADIWCEVLEVPEVGADDNFFDLGGHSILLQLVQSRITERTGKNVELIELFNHPTVHSLARHLDAGQGAGDQAGGVRGSGGRRPAGRVSRLGRRRAQLGAEASESGGVPGA